MAFIIHTSGDETETIPKNGSDFELAELQDIVGGLIECIPLTKGRLLVVNEEGLLENLPINTKASLLVGLPIVGTVVICDDDQLK
jgi:hypothetical protein